METWNKWVSAILWRSSRFARFVFTFNTSLFNFTNEILQRDFAIVFKGWPKEKSKLYSEDKEVMKILKDNTVSNTMAMIIAQHAAEMSL